MDTSLRLQISATLVLPPFSVLSPGATRFHSALLCYTLPVPMASIALMSLRKQTVREEEPREGASAANLTRIDLAKERVELYERAQQAVSRVRL